MLSRSRIGLEPMLGGLKGMAEATRLRILLLLARGDLTVKDLTAILSQSQPRISRHLRLLTEAGLVNRYPEGSWVYYRLAEAQLSAGQTAAADQSVRQALAHDARHKPSLRLLGRLETARQTANSAHRK